jgi:Omp85 superfamily domain
MRWLWLAIVLVAGAWPVAKAAEQGEPPGTGPAASCASSEECAKREGRGEVCVEARCQPYQDETDLFIAVGLSEPSPGPPVPFKPLLSVLPIIATNPTVGVMVGAAAILGIYLGDPETTTISNISANIMYTTKNQLLSGINSVLMLADNEWQLQGDWRFLVFNQDTFGLGTGHTPVSQGFTLSGFGTTAAISGAQPMDLNLLRIRETAFKKVWGPLYVGPGFSFDRYYAIHDLSLDLNATPAVVTSHYAYSKLNGFPTGAYTEAGISLNVLWDSRDSTINPYRGSYASLAYQWTPEFLGSTQSASLLSGEYRTYIGLSSAVPRNVLAFWVLAQTTVSGRLPYLALPAIGWDARNRTGRGYVQGRFRGSAEVYAEVEWRFRITTNGLLGGVVFANFETFSRPPVNYAGYTDPGESLFSYLRPSGGVGLRIMMNRQSRTNITVDLTVASKTVGFYLGAGEAF